MKPKACSLKDNLDGQILSQPTKRKRKKLIKLEVKSAIMANITVNQTTITKYFKTYSLPNCKVQEK